MQKLYEAGVEHRDIFGVFNSHRLLEMAVHTIPRTRHARHCSDLLVEKKREPLKRCYERDCNSANVFALHYDAAAILKYDIARIQ